MRAHLKKAAKRLVASAGSLLSFVLSPQLWFFLFAIGGAFLFVSAIRLLAGDAYALLAAGSFCFIAAALIGKGMSNA